MSKKRIHHPVIARWLLTRFRSRSNHESLIGDFDEIFMQIQEKQGKLKGRGWYWIQVMKSIPVFVNNSINGGTAMFINYMKIALRNLIRYKSFSTINIFGLSVSMACAFLIYLWIQDEIDYDRFHKDPVSIHRVMIDTKNYGIWNTTPIPLGPALENEFPDIINFARIQIFNGVFRIGENIYRERGYYIDPEFFEVFSYPLLSGDAGSVFNQLNSLVITEEMAKKYFGDEDPIGKTVNINNRDDFVVKGVLKASPGNSHFKFSFLVPFEIFRRSDREPDSFRRYQILTYIRTEQGSNVNDIEQKTANFLKNRNPEVNAELRLHPVTKIHLYNINGGGLITYLYVFSIIAIAIVVLASINSINMSTARSFSRAKEIGIRKINGAFRSDLAKQFLGEHLLYSFLALGIAIAASFILLPVFRDLIGADIPLENISYMDILKGSLIIGGLTGLISSVYPAYFLSSVRPLRLMKGGCIPGLKSDKRSLSKNALVVFQFAVSVFLVISTIFISKQVGMIKAKNLGFNKDNIIYFILRGNTGRQYESFRAELMNRQGVENVTIVSEPPIEISRVKTGWKWDGKPADIDPPMPHLMVGYDFFETFEIEFLQGRPFSRDLPSDAGEGYIINETAMRIIGDINPVGKSFAMNKREGWKEGRIIGVVKDFHFESLHSEIKPLVIDIYPEVYFSCVKLNNRDIDRTLNSISSVWNEFEPNLPFSYTFMEDYFYRMYESEDKTRNIMKYFMIIAVIISCLGLFSLTSFSIEQRRKEVGIRKVLGADVSGIIRLISAEFMLLIVIANGIAWPLTFISIRFWLRDFAYKIGIDLNVFFIALVISVFIASLTILFQVVKASMENPVDIIRHE